MRDLLSIGKLAEVLQRGPGEIQTALAELGIEPALRLNDLAYYSRDVVNRLRGFFFNVEKTAR